MVNIPAKQNGEDLDSLYFITLYNYPYGDK